jgi:hypothetical protein
MRRDGSAKKKKVTWSGVEDPSDFEDEADDEPALRGTCEGAEVVLVRAELPSAWSLAKVKARLVLATEVAAEAPPPVGETPSTAEKMDQAKPPSEGKFSDELAEILDAISHPQTAGKSADRVEHPPPAVVAPRAVHLLERVFVREEAAAGRWVPLGDAPTHRGWGEGALGSPCQPIELVGTDGGAELRLTSPSGEKLVWACEMRTRNLTHLVAGRG